MSYTGSYQELEVYSSIDNDFYPIGFEDLFVYSPTVVTPAIPPRIPEQIRGIRWANVKDGRADNVVHGGPRVYHINSVQLKVAEPSSKFIGDFDGVIRGRFVDARRIPIPESLRHYARGSVNDFGEPILRDLLP